MPTASALTWMGTIFYVDDAVLIARSPEELQLMLNACQQWAEKNRMSINVNKTKIVVFLEDPGTRKARQRFNFTLTPAHANTDATGVVAAQAHHQRNQGARANPGTQPGLSSEG